MPASPAPTCPRCEYDLSGLVATWTSECPMQALCSECGLTFECANVLSPRMLGPGWSYEHGLRAGLGRWVRTSLVSLNPWRLWARMRIDHVVRGWRLLSFALVWCALIHAVAVSLRGWSVIVAGAGPRGFGWLYALQSGFDDQPLGPIGVLLFPYARLGRTYWSWSWQDFSFQPLLALTLIPTLLMPAWMLILGTTLAQAKVRRIHLLRGLAYSLPGAAAWTVLIFTGVTLALMAQRAALAPSVDWAMVMAGLALCFPLYHGLWWWLFIRRYLRLRHAAATVLLLMIMSGLVAAILLLYLRYGSPF